MASDVFRQPSSGCDDHVRARVRGLHLIARVINYVMHHVICLHDVISGALQVVVVNAFNVIEHA